MKRLTRCIVLVIASGTAVVCSGQSPIVVVAGGNAGNWETFVELANPSDQEIDGTYFLGTYSCFAFCPPLAEYHLPPRGSAEIAFRKGSSAVQLQALEIRYEGAEAPSVRAFARDGVTGNVNEILASSLASIESRPDPRVLEFPGLALGGGAHVNIALASLTPDLAPMEPLSVGFTAKLEIFDASGTLLAQNVVSACGPSQPCPDLFLVDVARALGIGDTATSPVALRVTQISGGDVLWGEAVNVNREGFVTTVPGFNP